MENWAKGDQPFHRFLGKKSAMYNGADFSSTAPLDITFRDNNFGTPCRNIIIDNIVSCLLHYFECLLCCLKNNQL